MGQHLLSWDTLPHLMEPHQGLNLTGVNHRHQYTVLIMQGGTLSLKFTPLMIVQVAVHGEQVIQLHLRQLFSQAGLRKPQLRVKCYDWGGCVPAFA